MTVPQIETHLNRTPAFSPPQPVGPSYDRQWFCDYYGLEPARFDSVDIITSQTNRKQAVLVIAQTLRRLRLNLTPATYFADSLQATIGGQDGLAIENIAGFIGAISRLDWRASGAVGSRVVPWMTVYHSDQDGANQLTMLYRLPKQDGQPKVGDNLANIAYTTPATDIAAGNIDRVEESGAKLELPWQSSLIPQDHFRIQLGERVLGCYTKDAFTNERGEYTTSISHVTMHSGELRPRYHRVLAVLEKIAPHDLPWQRNISGPRERDKWVPA